MIRQITAIVVTTAGGAGTSTGTGASTAPVSGRVVAVHLDYSASQAATADVTITAGTPAQTVLIKANTATDGWYYPHTPAHLASDGSVIASGVVLGVPVDGYVNVAVAQGNDGETVTVTVIVEV